ncbi:MAG: glycosyltransferase family 39 protein [Microgenomates group bacterium]
MKIGKQKAILVIFLLFHLFLIIRLQFTAWPEMTLWPYLITKGWLPYKDIAVVHTPLLFVDLTILYKLFGVGLWQLKIYTWLLILLTDVLIFYVAKEIWSKKIAICSMLLFIPLQLFYEGNGLWFDLALVPIALIIFYFVKKKEYLWAGVFWALAFLTKQTAFWFLLPVGLMFFPNEVFEKIKKFILGICIVFFPTLLIIWAIGILPDFIYWAFKFGIGTLPKASGQVNLPTIRQLATSLLPFSVFIFLPFVQKRKKDLILVVWAICGFLGAFPRFELFHFQPALPFLAIGAGMVFVNIKKFKPVFNHLLLGYALLILVLVSRSFAREWGRGNRFFEPEVVNLASYVKENTEPNDKIYVLNAWDSIYAWSDTLPAVMPWIPHLPWYMELPGVQEDIVSGLDIVRPKLILQGEYSETGLGSYKPKLIDEFIKDNYEISDKIGGYLILRGK